MTWRDGNGYGDSRAAIVIVGNKCDLKNQRQVTKDEGIAYAKECNAPFYETSALQKINTRQS